MHMSDIFELLVIVMFRRWGGNVQDLFVAYLSESGLELKSKALNL